ncbi:hypothetical protein FN846DRAFT_1012652 [Sphaerosporella brunnea]|uniref:Uncharacterized protein n=1 Tax=Sphaerosporella brunnea TaxID=1250544 RepID=A0A5J5EXV9_9PEZI|nr:hypothetical protein FN846DRAFT_1012652 [Sphaerosporella brunnea]
MASAAITHSDTQPLQWCGRDLEAFTAATDLEILAPSEHRGQFNSKTHQQGYEKLLSGLMREKERLRIRQREETRAEKNRLQVEKAKESVEFHKEFLELLKWGGDECVLSLDPERMHRYITRLKAQPVESRFPAVVAYFASFPDRSIAWAVEDFYKWQQARYLHAMGLRGVMYRWDWCETCWMFQRAAARIRRENGSILSLRRFCGTGKQAVMEWRERRRRQWKAVREIWNRCQEVGIAFPARICPGGQTPMRFFRNDHDGSFGSYRVEAAIAVSEEEMKREIEAMVGYEALEEYYKEHACAAGKVVDEEQEELDMGVETVDEESSLDVDLEVDIEVSMPMPGTFPRTSTSTFGNRAAFQDANGVRIGYSASVDGRISTKELASFRRIEAPSREPAEWNHGWHSVRVCHIRHIVMLFENLADYG